MKHRWDEFELDVFARRLLRGGEQVHVEPQVFDVLVLLIERRDRVVLKEEILDEVWGDRFVSESALTTRIKEARRALGDDGRTQRYIRNAHGRGYHFVGELVMAASSVAERPEARASALRLALDITVDDEFPFVGRVEELSTVADFVDDRDSSGAQVLIAGVPGSGKSRLAVELLERWSGAGRFVSAGRCDEQVRSALQPVRDCFTQLAAVHPDRVASWVAGVEGQMLSLIPSLVAHIDHDPVQVDAYAGIDVFLTVFERVASDGPVTMLIDDLQWSDEPTRGFLGRLHRRLAGLPVVSVYTFRSSRGDLPADVDAWIREQGRHTATVRLDLGDLDDAAASELVGSVLGYADDEVASVVATIAGSCLFLTESIRDLQLGASTAGSVAELVTARVARQTNDVQALIRTAALLGPEFSFSTAASASGLSPADALAAIDAAIDAELLHETASPARFRFSHQLVPQAIADSLSRPSLAVIHHACADTLEAEEGDPIEIATHLLGAVPLIQLDQAVDAARGAAAVAVENKQFDRAIRLLDRTLHVAGQARGRAEIMLEIGDAHLARGTTAEAVHLFESAAEVGRTNGWADILASAALGHWGRSPFRNLRDRSTLRLLREADRALGEEPSLTKARVRAQIAAFSLFSTRLAGRIELVDAAIAMAPDATGEDRMELLESKAVVHSCPAGVDALDVIDPELDLLRSEHKTYFADAAVPETRHLMRGDGEAFRGVADVDQERTEAQPISAWRDAVLGSTLAVFAGDFDTAERRCNDGGAIGERFWGDSSASLHAMGLLFVDCVSGTWTRALPALGQLDTRAQVLIPPHAWALAATGDLAGASDVWSRFRRRNFGWLGEHILGGSALIAAGEVALLLADDDLIAAAYEQLLVFRDIVLGVPWACSLAAADTLSRLASARSDADAASAHRERARELYTGLDAPALLERLS